MACSMHKTASLHKNVFCPFDTNDKIISRLSQPFVIACRSLVSDGQRGLMEETLLGRLKNSFSEFVAKYDNIVDKVLVSRSRKQLAKEDLEDLKQEIWLKAWRALPDYQEQGSPASWLKAISDNTVLDLLKRKNPSKPNARLEMDEPDPIENIQDPEDGETAIARRALRNEEIKALQDLPEGQRKIFIDHYLKGLSIQTIAKERKRTEGTIKKQLSNARKNLIHNLSERGVTPTDFPGQALAGKR
jgi:RNA polymerase sigma-70 factor (ECF subfamily)